MTLTRFTRIVAWLSLLAILFVTVAPIAFRPESGYSPNIERFAAFAFVAGLFATAYSETPFSVMILLWIAAISFELLQFHALGRHAEIRDVAFKCAGAAAGTSCGVFAKLFLDRIAVGLKQT